MIGHSWTKKGLRFWVTVKSKYIGTFDTLEQAQAAQVNAEQTFEPKTPPKFEPPLE